MNIDVVHGSCDKRDASQALEKALSHGLQTPGALFIGYPLIGTPNGRYEFDALLVTPRHGIVLIDLVESPDVGNFHSRQDDSANKMAAFLRVHPEMVDGRELRIAINTLTLAINSSESNHGSHVLCNDSAKLAEKIEQLPIASINQDAYESALSIIETVSSVRKFGEKRTPVIKNSRGWKLAKLENQIAMLARMQNQAIIEIPEGVQRIRGLAGSGKTIVLALKAAYLHAKYPEWRIAVTFYTRSLKDGFKQYIDHFHYRRTGESPNWDNLRIVNAWGSSSDDQPGLYYEYCEESGATFVRFTDACLEYGEKNTFGGVCSEVLKHCSSLAKYDVILVDDAHEFPPEFLRLCYGFLREPKRLVYAYDELQNLDHEALPSPADIFGHDDQEQPVFSLSSPSQDIVLNVCYRTADSVLATAHALGFGIYRQPPVDGETGLVQMFDDPGLWHDVGYAVKRGILSSGNRVVLGRSDDASPTYLHDHSEGTDLIQFKSFESERDQDTWIAEQIHENVSNDELNPSDILIVHPDPRWIVSRTSDIRASLLRLGIETYVTGIQGHAREFRPHDDLVVITSIHHVKGHEAAMVYVMDAHECQSEGIDLATRRNLLSSAICRSKAWARVVGVGSPMSELVKEYESVAENDFQLNFRYPTAKQLKSMRSKYHDRSREETTAVNRANVAMKELRQLLENGDCSQNDLNIEELSQLRHLLEADT